MQFADKHEDFRPVEVNGQLQFDLNTDYLETWRALEDLQLAGRVRHIGLSNFNEAQLERVVTNARVRPHVLQVVTDPIDCSDQSIDRSVSKLLFVLLFIY